MGAPSGQGNKPWVHALAPREDVLSLISDIPFHGHLRALHLPGKHGMTLRQQLRNTLLRWFFLHSDGLMLRAGPATLGANSPAQG